GSLGLGRCFGFVGFLLCHDPVSVGRGLNTPIRESVALVLLYHLRSTIQGWPISGLFAAHKHIRRKFLYPIYRFAPCDCETINRGVLPFVLPERLLIPYPCTVIPMLRAVPSTIRAACSSSRAFRSASLSRAISRTCWGVTAKPLYLPLFLVFSSALMSS